MSKNNKRFATVGLTAGLLAGGAAGLILQASGSASAAQGTQTSTPVTDSGAADPAGRAADREARAAEHLAEALAPLVADGTLTQEQADKVVAALQAARHPAMSKAAEVLGITIDELRTEIASGKTIAEVAIAKGKTAQEVIDALVAQIKTKLDAQVANQDITQKVADERLVKATERVTTFVNETQTARRGPDMGPGNGGRHGGPRGGKGMGQPGGDPTTTG